MDVLSVESFSVGLPSRKNAGGPQDSGPATIFQVDPGALKNPGAPTAEDVKGGSSPGAIAEAIKQVNDAFSQIGQGLYASYQKDKITGIDVVQFRDANTKEVVRQIPSKEILAVAQSLSLPSGIQGQLIYDKA